MPWNFSTYVQDITKALESTTRYLAEHPWYSTIGAAVITSLFATRLYCRYTLGMCRCTTDLTGKVVVITGGNAGIGKETAMELAKRNARVIIGSRNVERGVKAVKEIVQATGNLSVEFRQLDLSIFHSVRNFAAGIIDTEEKLHILINNAGVTGSGGRRITEDGCEYIMQANYFGHFLLTSLLLDLMKKSQPSRIINTSSMVYNWAKLDLEDLDSKRKYNSTDIYNKTKLANVLFTTELAKRLSGTGVTVNVLHPGVVKTDIVENTPSIDAFITKLLFAIVGKTPFEGAQTTIHLALSPNLEKVSGKYFSDCKEEKLTKSGLDENLAKRLFKISEDIVGAKIDA